MRRFTAAFAVLVLVAVCGAEKAKADPEVERLVNEANAAWTASRRAVGLSERIARLREAVAAQEALEKRSARRARDNPAKYARDDLEEATKAQTSTPCIPPPLPSCLLAEAEKRIKRGDPREAIQVAILLRATGEPRFADRFREILAEMPPMYETLGIPAELAAANAGDLLDEFAKAMSRKSGYEDAAAVALFLKNDRAGYAAMLEKLRANGSLDDLKAGAIAEQTRDPALFAEALEKALKFIPQYVPLRLNALILYMAAADMADETRALAARKEPPVAGPDLRVAALAILAGKRRDIDSLQELSRSLAPVASNAVVRSQFGYWGMARGWVLAGRIDEAAAIVRAHLTVESVSDVVAEIAVARARAGRAIEALDVLLALDLAVRDQRTHVVRAFAEAAVALR